jgi:hypothetical protein
VTLPALECWAPYAPRAVERRVLELLIEGPPSVTALALRRLSASLVPLRPLPAVGRVWAVALLDDPPWLDGVPVQVVSRGDGRAGGEFPRESWAAVNQHALPLLGAPGHDRGAPCFEPPLGSLPLAVRAAGRSADLAALVATVSRLSGIAPRGDFVVAGTLRVEGGLVLAAPTDADGAKAAVAARELPGARFLALPGEVPAADVLDEILGPDWRLLDHASAEDLVEDAAQANVAGRYEHAEALAERALAHPAGGEVSSDPPRALLAALAAGHPDRPIEDVAAATLRVLDASRPPPPAAWTAVPDPVLRRWSAGATGGDALAARIASLAGAFDDAPTAEAHAALVAPETRGEAASFLRRRAPY